MAALNSVIDPDGGQGEPSMGITPNGTIFADSGINYGPLMAERSTDGGATWRAMGAPLRPYPDYDPDLAVAADGTVWLDELSTTMTSQMTGTPSRFLCATASSSRDNGDTWSPANPNACFPPGADRQYIIPTTPGTAYIYLHQNDEIAEYQGIAKTTDYGKSWVPVGWGDGPFSTNVSPSYFTSGSDWGGGGFWNAKTGSVFLTFTWIATPFPQGAVDPNAPFTWAPAFSVSRDAGKSWQLETLPNAGGAWASGLSLVTGAADSGGNVYLTWAELAKDHESMHVYLAASKDDGRTWTKPLQVDADNNSKLFPAVTAGAPGHVAVGYYEANQVGPSMNLTNQAQWNLTVAWTADALAGSPTFQFGQLSERSLREGSICGEGSACYRSRQALDYFALHTTPDGRVAAVWTSTTEAPGEVRNVFGVSKDPVLGGGPWPAGSAAAVAGPSESVPLLPTAGPAPAARPSTST
jgi:hypothetical protein